MEDDDGDARLHEEVDALMTQHRERIRELQASFSAMSTEAAQSQASLAARHAEEQAQWDAERSALLATIDNLQALLDGERETVAGLETRLSGAEARALDYAQQVSDLMSAAKQAEQAQQDQQAQQAQQALQDQQAEQAEQAEQSAVAMAEVQAELDAALDKIVVLEETVRAECEERIQLKLYIKTLKARQRG